MITIRHLSRHAAVAAAGLMLAGLAVPASANEAAPAQGQAQHQSAQRNDRDQREICVRTTITGSRMVKRICKTAAEWEAEGGLPTDE
jgi:hypothetical protein